MVTSSCALRALHTSRAEDAKVAGRNAESVFLLCALIPSVILTNTAVAEGEWQTFQVMKIVLISQRHRSFICHYLANYSLIRTLVRKFPNSIKVLLLLSFWQGCVISDLSFRICFASLLFCDFKMYIECANK